MKLSKKVTLPLRIFTGFILLVSIYLLFKQLNDLVGYIADDYLSHFMYQGEWPTGTPAHINNWGDLNRSIIYYASHFNGQFVAQYFVQIFMQMPKAVFNVINSLMYLGLGLLINVHVFGRLKNLRVGYLFVTYAMLWFVLPDWGASILWLTGGINYLWMAVLYLLFILPYRFNHQFKHVNWATIGMLLAGFVIGSTIKTAIPTVLLVTLLLTISDRHESQSTWKWAGIAGMVAGFINLLVHGVGQAAHGALWQSILTLSMPLIIAVFLLIAYLVFLQRKLELPIIAQNLKIARLYLTGTLLGILMLATTSNITARSFFTPNILLLIAFLSLLYAHTPVNPQASLDKWFPFAVAAVMAFYVIPSYDDAIRQNTPLHNVDYTAQQQIKQSRQIKQKFIDTPGMPPVTSSYAYTLHEAYLISGKPEKQWFNTWMAQYYNLDYVNVDNRVRIQIAPQNKNALDWQLYRGLTNFHTATVNLVHKPKTSVNIGARTAKLLYVNQKNQILGQTTIKGKIGSVTDVSQIAMPGYVIDGSALRYYTFTAAKHQQRRIHVLPMPVSKGAAPKHEMLRTAQLLYVDQGKHVVKREPITGYVGGDFDISNASVPGYTTDAKTPKKYTFTKAKHQTFRIKVRKTPVLGKAVIEYTLASGKVVATEPINGPVGSKMSLAGAATAGYQTLPNNKLTYKFTTKQHQVIKMNVLGAPQTAQLTFVNNKGTVVAKQTVWAETGDSTNIIPPAKFKLAHNQVNQVKLTPQGLTPATVLVQPRSFLGQFVHNTKAFWITIGTLVFIIVDLIGFYCLKKRELPLTEETLD
ncbi:hypothetical protein EQG49_06310 [Periweissella cryptocerci]|uniref:MucBP domain-containing protein n=1 Tax=Periweissella cryptocerci TaxID=2506420 RepID=A0A4V1AIN2_9LACO|nr:DUF6056 family protein [Periweissella cryptocerci]QBO36095.1 hypothetical protein EQG49_06310 [Periweissella cryptocerci]